MEVIPIPKFTNWSDLEKHLKKSVNSAMEKEGFEQVKKTEAEMIDKNVYSAYSPRVYNRRRDYDFDSSLANPDNIECEIVGDGKLLVKNTTEVNSGWRTQNTGFLTPIIKSGDGYDYSGDGSGAYLKPRDFEAETVRELEHSGELEQAIKKGLQRQGIKADIK